MDVVYVLGERSKLGADHDLVRYSFRSIEKNMPDVGNVFIVGSKPVWASGIIHIPHADNDCTAKNITNKILAACSDGRVSDDFILFADDYFLLSKDVDWSAVPTWGDYTNKKVSARTEFGDALRSTIAYMIGAGLKPMNFEAHCPIVINKREYISVQENHPQPKDGFYVPTSIYLSLKSGISHIPARDVCAYMGGIQAESSFSKTMRGKWFMNLASSFVSDGQKRILSELFPIASKYESSNAKGSEIINSIRDLGAESVDFSVINEGNDTSILNVTSRFRVRGQMENPTDGGLIYDRRVPETGTDIKDEDNGVMLIAFGYEYAKITQNVIDSIRKFSQIPITVHTNIIEHNLSLVGKNVTVIHYEMHDGENRVIKTQLSKYTNFKNTLYIDVDSVVLSAEFLELFKMLSYSDILFPKWKRLNISQVSRAANADHKFKRFLMVFEKFGMRNEQMVAGGMCCFRKNDKIDSFFDTYHELWKFTGKNQDMPGLNGALYLHSGSLRYGLLDQSEYNGTNSSVIASLHSANDARLTDFTRVRFNPRTGRDEYMRQGEAKFFTKPRVAIFYDVVGWAFYNMASELKKELYRDFDIDLLSVMSEFNEDDYDVFLCFSPGVSPILKDRSKLLCGISSHGRKNYENIVSGMRAGFTNDESIYNSITPKRKWYIPNGVNMGLFTNKSKRARSLKVIGAVGSLAREEHKGKGRVMEIAKRSKLSTNLLFIDPNAAISQKDMVEYYREIDILLISSYSETGPNTLLEALSMGKPVLANSVGLVDKLIVNGHNGYKVDSYDDISGYVSILNKLKGNPSEFRKIASNARESVSEYSWEIISEQYKTMINEFIQTIRK